MQVTKDEWSPLFRNLKSKLSAGSRKALMREIIYDMKDLTLSSFGAAGRNRPSAWVRLKDKYARRVGRSYPTLVMTPSERILAGKALSKPHLINQFSVDVRGDSASLHNASEYAEAHQNGKPEGNLPARPYFPIDGESKRLSPAAEIKIRERMKSHFSD